MSHDRIDKLPDGRIRLRLKKPWQNGTTHLVLTPLDLLARLAAMVPPPKMHQIRYHGVLAANANLRSTLVPGKQPESGEQLCLFDSQGHAKPHPGSSPTPLGRVAWAKLLRRTMGYDLETFPACQGPMKVTRFAFAQSEIMEAVRRYGTEDDLAAMFRDVHPARAPPSPQLSLPFSGPAQTRQTQRPTGS